MTQYDNEGNQIQPEVIRQLVQVASKHLDKRTIYVEHTTDTTLWQTSCVGWKDGHATRLKAYHHDTGLLPAVLAHEVGHLETMESLGGIAFHKSNERNRYHAEAMASKWALAYIKPLISKAQYKAGAEALQGCLDRYKPKDAKRYVLDGARGQSYAKSLADGKFDRTK